MPRSPWAIHTWIVRLCTPLAFTGSSRETTTRTPRSGWNTARRARRLGERGRRSSGSSGGAHRAEKYGSRLEVPDDGWLFAGSVLLLDPGTSYELRLTLKDPDGGSAARTLKSQTRSEPQVSPRARRRLVVPGTGGGSGTGKDPFRGLESTSRPRHPGTSSCWRPGSMREPGRFTAAARPPSRSSGAGRATVRPSSTDRCRAAGARARRSPPRAATTSGSRTSTIRNADYGVVSHDSARIVVRRCHIHASTTASPPPGIRRPRWTTSSSPTT